MIHDEYNAGFTSTAGVPEWRGPNGLVRKNRDGTFTWERDFPLSACIGPDPIPDLEGQSDTWEVAVLCAEGHNPDEMDVTDEDIMHLSVAVGPDGMSVDIFKLPANGALDELFGRAPYGPANA
jgi:hypothetical protein